MTTTSAATTAPVTFAELLAARPTGGPAWLGDLRAASAARWQSLGFPTRKQEDWRFTKLELLRDMALRPPAPPTRETPLPDLDAIGMAELDAYELVFIDGVCVTPTVELTLLMKGAWISSWAGLWGPDAVESAHIRERVRECYGAVAGETDIPFTALNTAMAMDGAVVVLQPDTTLAKPLRVVYLASGTTPDAAIHPRLLVCAGRHSKATIIEQYLSLSDARYCANAVSEFDLAEGANIDHYRLQQDSLNAVHVSGTYVRQAGTSEFRSHAVSLGGGATRNDVVATFAGRGSTCTLNGLYLAGGSQFVDNHTVINHAVPDCQSYEIYKGILDGKADGVFNGKIFVQKDAQRTDAKQTNRALLLSRDAKVNTKPQLEIFADDVKCTHGATIGQLDQDAMFYLQARGIGEVEARALLTRAFALEALEDIRVDELQHELERLLNAKFLDYREA